jgi:hypothetical protein
MLDLLFLIGLSAVALMFFCWFGGKGAQQAAALGHEDDRDMVFTGTKLEVTVCSARNLPHVDGVWGFCDAFLVLEYKTQTHTSTVLSAVAASCCMSPLALRPLPHSRHIPVPLLTREA